MVEMVEPILCAGGNRASHGYLDVHEITCLNSRSSLQLTVFLIRSTHEVTRGCCFHFLC